MGYHHEKHCHACQTDDLRHSPVDTAEHTQGMFLRKFRKPPAHSPFCISLYSLPRSVHGVCRSIHGVCCSMPAILPAMPAGPAFMHTGLIVPVRTVFHPVHECAQTALTAVLTHCLPPLTHRPYTV